MNFKEFKKYNASKTSNVTVNPDGSMNNDNYFKFNVSYKNEEGITQNDPIIAKSASEAIYRFCVVMLLHHIPQEQEIADNMNNPTSQEYRNLYDNISYYKDFSHFSITVESEKKVKIILTTFEGIDDIYYLMVDESDDKDHDIIFDANIYDNMISVYTKQFDDENVIICSISSSITEIDTVFKRPEMPLDRYFGYMRQILMLSTNSMVASIGFASLNAGDEYDETIGKDIAYHRALARKIRSNRLFAVNAKKQILNVIHNAWTDFYKYRRLVKKLDKRYEQELEKSKKYSKINK